MGSLNEGVSMRFGVIATALILSACGGVPGFEANPDLETGQPAEPTHEAPKFAIQPGPNCNREKTLSEVLELVQQDGQAMPDPWAERQSAQRTERFGKLLNFVGNCYRATPTADSVEQTADIQFWSMALGGAAITIEHALEDGSYGGISYFYPKAEPAMFTYVYITNAGFHTQGTITVNDDQSFTASETVSGHRQ